MVKNLRICVNNVTTSSSTPSATLSPAQSRVLGDVVSSCQPHEGALTSVITAGDYNLSVTGKNPHVCSRSRSAEELRANQTDRLRKRSLCYDTVIRVLSSCVSVATTPWFESYRENFLQSMPASDHEFLNHYLACILHMAL